MATKNELVQEIKRKTKKASPMVKKCFYSGLINLKKSDLERMAKNARVVEHGDIHIG